MISIIIGSVCIGFGISCVFVFRNIRAVLVGMFIIGLGILIVVASFLQIG